MILLLKENFLNCRVDLKSKKYKKRKREKKESDLDLDVLNKESENSDEL